MDPNYWMTFPSLIGLRHRFVLRHPDLDMQVDRAEALARLAPWHEAYVQELGFEPSQVRTAEQVHDNLVAVVDRHSPAYTLGADGLITSDPAVLLGVYVADCGAVFLTDRKSGAVGLVHSGRKGTELGITARAIQLMAAEFGADPADMVVQLSPCIRPPSYEVDFAAGIRQQCIDQGIAADHFHDCGLCTSTDLQRFYSYRIEKGRTGRMLALLSCLPG